MADDLLAALSPQQRQKYAHEYLNPNPAFLRQKTTPPASAMAETRAVRAAKMTITERRGYRTGYLAGVQTNGRTWRRLCGAIARSLRRVAAQEIL